LTCYNFHVTWTRKLHTYGFGWGRWSTKACLEAPILESSFWGDGEFVQIGWGDGEFVQIGWVEEID
jgi:hypothetical protein